MEKGTEGKMRAVRAAGHQRDDPIAALLGEEQAEGVLPTAVSQRHSSNRFPFP